jgi:hypothetical protein
LAQSADFAWPACACKQASSTKEVKPEQFFKNQPKATPWGRPQSVAFLFEEKHEEAYAA